MLNLALFPKEIQSVRLPMHQVKSKNQDMAEILDFNVLLSCKRGSKGEQSLNLHLLHLQEQHHSHRMGHGLSGFKITLYNYWGGRHFSGVWDQTPEETNHLFLPPLEILLVGIYFYQLILTRKIRQRCINELTRHLFSLYTAWQFLSKLLNNF